MRQGHFKLVFVMLCLLGLLWGLPAAAQEAVAPGQTVSGTVVEGSPVNYVLNASEGDTITVRTQTGERSLRHRIYGAGDERVSTEYSKVGSARSAYVFNLDEPGPYRLELDGASAYTLTVESGNTLTVDRGAVALGSALTATATPDTLDLYRLDVPANTVVTLNMSVGGSLALSGSLRLDDVSNDLRQAEVSTVQSRGIVYALTEAGTYIVVANIYEGEYTLSVTEGDGLSSEMSALAPGQTVSGTVELGRVNVYSISANPEDRVTVDFQTGAAGASGLLPGVAIVGQGFRRVETESEVENAVVFVLDEDPPYALIVTGEGSYTLSWTTGDALTSAGGALVAGEPLVAGLAAGQPAVFTLEGLPEGSAGSLMVGGEVGIGFRPFASALALTNGAGETLPLARVPFETFPLVADYDVWLFTLSGPAPYTLTIEGEQAAPLVLNRTLKPGDSAPVSVAAFESAVFTLIPDAAQTEIAVALAERMPTLYDAQGTQIGRRVQERVVNGQRVVVFALTGSAPYILDVRPGDTPLDTTVGLLRADDVAAAALPITPGENRTLTTTLSGETFVLPINAPEGARVGLIVDVPFDLRERLFLLTNVFSADGSILSRENARAYGANYPVYTLAGPAPYRLEITRPADSTLPDTFDLYVYTIDASAANPRERTIALGETVSGRPVGNAAGASYLLELAAAQVVSIRLESAAFVPETLEVFLAAQAISSPLPPQSLTLGDGALVATFALQAGAYQVAFPATGDFTLTVTGG